jgi:hypothetical protein
MCSTWTPVMFLTVLLADFTAHLAASVQLSSELPTTSMTLAMLFVPIGFYFFFTIGVRQLSTDDGTRKSHKKTRDPEKIVRGLVCDQNSDSAVSKSDGDAPLRGHAPNCEVKRWTFWRP